ncbi:cyclophilin-like domain-containing protein [Polychytrium aggregatum]|uniref:cyclophilin-like domain-containing protein n=1 Tax=Polychytrium aggregatum TaxID=110093 RepID=UPI0022FECD3F|nr:cyclophilin-like domain-containing protein [Polychytrium aggregatum]KAI9193420.1 cyclophilin-like domain-containing protein [Polychytrium aggregatum]
MGKHTDKLYITHSEWATDFGGAKSSQPKSNFKRLPFFCCSLSLQPVEHPMCTPEGIVFDLVNIVPWLKQYGTNPVTGEKLEAKQLFRLKFHKNAGDEYHCPVTFKVFNEHTHIVAIKPTGNVYAFEAVEKLNIKTKHWVDLLEDVPFTRKDIITIQDPHNLSTRNISDFHYLKNDLKVDNPDEDAKKSMVSYKIKTTSGTASRVLSELSKGAGDTDDLTKSPAGASAALTPAYEKKEKKAYNAAHYSTGAAAMSLTSTAIDVQTRNEAAIIDDEEYMLTHVTGVGYAQLVTNVGNINLELFCKDTPRACYNFITLAKREYYAGTKFHRSIKHFMIQGGDPTGTGRGGESCWGKDFGDEFKSNLSHNARGILSMANKGKNTNSSQFFITYRPCTHLDNKHTVFGKVVGGMDVLGKMEKIETDDRDNPLDDIKLIKVNVFVDPFDEFQKKLEGTIKDSAGPKDPKESRPKKQPAVSIPTPSASTQIGKYIGADGEAGKKRASTLDDDLKFSADVGGVQIKKAKPSKGFGDFSGW